MVSSTGYFTNIIAAQGLRSTIDHVYLDERAHGSLRDAAVILGCDVTEFRHRDPAVLKEKLRRGGRRVAVLTDGMFSHSGAIAPVEEYRAVIGQSALLWVDDAHAGGVWGDGRGSVEAAGISRRNTLQTVTFSKAFGTYGGAILCSENVARKISERSAAVGGNTPMPLPLAGGTIKSLELCDKELREKLRGNIAEFWRGVGQPPPQVLSPIVSFSPRDPDSLRRKLVAARIYPPLIHYPGGPAKGYFRFAISSEHSAAQITMLAEVLAAYASTLMR